jgi:AcrR family transcriptional regulator
LTAGAVDPTIRGIATGGTHRLSKDSIVEAYLRVVEEDGEAPTLRRLGNELGTDATAVYRHFRSKDQLLAAAVDRVLADIVDELDTSGRWSGHWKDDLRALLLAARRVYVQHPQALLALEREPLELENGFAAADRSIGLLEASGLPLDEVPIAFEALESYTIGAALFDARVTPDSQERWRKVFAQLPADRFPHLARLGEEFYRDADDAFGYGLDCLLTAIENRVRTQGASSPCSDRTDEQTLRGDR